VNQNIYDLVTLKQYLPQRNNYLKAYDCCSTILYDNVFWALKESTRYVNHTKKKDYREGYMQLPKDN